MEKKKVLLIDPSYGEIYSKSNFHLYKASSKSKKKKVPYNPVLGLAAIGGVLLRENCEVKILDMNLPDQAASLGEVLESFKPDFVGITFVSGLFNEAKKIVESIKEKDKEIIVFGGGTHCSAFPEQTLKESILDFVVVGEADVTIAEIMRGMPWSEIKGMSYKKDGQIFNNPKRELIEDMDSLPFPAWHLYDIQRYHAPRTVSRKTPAGWLETSRGCVFGCTYCTKSIFSRRFRVKSQKRVLDEIEYMLNLGFKEIHIADDCFNTDMKRGKEICDGIISRGLKFPWSTLTGIRVDLVDEELFYKMKKSGCYRVYFGIESGNQEIINRVDKAITLDKVRNAVKLANKAGLETVGYFMLGLPDETEETMRQTIDFAKELDLDLAKTTITSPLPSTKLYEEYDKKGLIKIKDWSQFNLYITPKEVYKHPTLDWDVVEEYNKKFYREFYLRPRFILKRLIKGIMHGTLFSDFKQLLDTHW